MLETNTVTVAMTEYTVLRSEILKRIELMHQVASLGFLVPGTIFAFGFRTRDANIHETTTHKPFSGYDVEAKRGSELPQEPAEDLGPNWPLFCLDGLLESMGYALRFLKSQ